MKRFRALVAFWLVACWMILAGGLSTPAWACNEPCGSDADCSASDCHYCDTEFGICSDCCEFTEAITCPAQPGCKWEYGECRNESGRSCGIHIPETPRAARYWFFILLAAAGAASLFLAQKFRPKKA